MGSLANWEIALEGCAALLLGLLMLLGAHNRAHYALGVLWVSQSLFNASVLLWGNSTRWSDMGNYFLYISAMLAIAFFPQRKRVSSRS
jgi:uncharacterized membrane protein YadS